MSCSVGSEVLSIDTANACTTSTIAVGFLCCGRRHISKVRGKCIDYRRCWIIRNATEGSKSSDKKGHRELLAIVWHSALLKKSGTAECARDPDARSRLMLIDDASELCRRIDRRRKEDTSIRAAGSAGYREVGGRQSSQSSSSVPTTLEV
mmetsp:Transcript_12648/g.27384  ORF Transcript_12648/g.27384 Transcript_12648/m.27384 type:complete len:150 (+) Transcript_12648:1294-1743(+)